MTIAAVTREAACVFFMANTSPALSVCIRLVAIGSDDVGAAVGQNDFAGRSLVLRHVARVAAPDRDGRSHVERLGFPAAPNELGRSLGFKPPMLDVVVG